MKPLVLDIYKDLLDFWFQAEGFHKLLYLSGLLLIASGFFHLGILWVEGSSWEGATSWRKPALFGISSGVTAISIGWVLGLVPWKNNTLNTTFSYIFSVAILVEVFLITFQTWREEASHFNNSTFVNSLTYITIDALVLVLTLQIFILTFRAFQTSPSPRASMRLAVQAGMALLGIACILGFWTLIHGHFQKQSGLPPEIYGDAGVVKFVHGIPIHAIQYLPLLAWFLEKVTSDSSKKIYWAVMSSTIGTVLFTLYALLQTLNGRSRFDFSVDSLLLFVISLILVISPLVYAMYRFFTRINSKRF